MHKIFFLIVCFFVFSKASIIHFEEEKYIEVIDNSLHKKGTLEFIDNKIKLKYNNSSRVLIYEDDTLLISQNNEIQEINLKNQIAIKMIFLLIDSIHTNQFDIIKEYFTISKKNDINYLTPKQNITNYIISIEFKKNKTLKYITIKMINGNITTIREMND